MNDKRPEEIACKAVPVDSKGFNPRAKIPYGLTIGQIHLAMNDFIEFISFVNTQLHSKELPRLESFLMPANFSSMVGEFMSSIIPQYCDSLVKNLYHNGHPDLVPKGTYQDDSILHGSEGIEIKSSRHKQGWQGHNPEDVWLMVFVFEANSSRDKQQGKEPKPFCFTKIVGAQLTKKDWSFSGRSKTSGRTITASVTKSGFEKMEANWIYRVPN